MLKLVTILGARPQFIKAGSVSREIARNEGIQEVIVHTGQHYDANMSKVFFNEMQIPTPDYFLNIGGASHGAMVGQMIERIEEVLVKEKPDYVMVYGDTNSTLAGSIAASKLNIKIVHIEAGLRSFNMKMPEEVNRILADRISSILFCPTQASVENLEKEGIKNWNTGAKVYKVGDVMEDGAIFYKKLARKPAKFEISNDFILCTIHRAENTDDQIRLSQIISSLNEIAQEKEIVIPVHPRTRKVLKKNNYDISNLKLIEPVGYLNMVWLIDNCSLVMTDSGGLQKEAFFYKKPCITLRDETEWIELVENNYNILAGAERRKILSSFNSHMFSKKFDENLYGGGNASNKIVKILIESKL